MASSATAAAAAAFSPAAISDLHPPARLASMNMDELLRNIYSSPSTPKLEASFSSSAAAADGAALVEMTLEDFLAREGAVSPEHDLPGRGRGRKRPAGDPADRAALQRQKRMIKNRESAARSRERKQAYTVELEKLVHELEEENARLVREEAEMKKQRLKQLMENLIPVTDSKKPPRVLRRTLSWEW